MKRAHRRTYLLILLVGVVYLLHQDFWNWDKIKPLVFGFVPIGLAYHLGYSLLATAVMAVLVKFAWPNHLDSLDTDGSTSSGRFD